MNRKILSVKERRAQTQMEVQKLGIDDGYISILVDTFYEKIRLDKNIGPIFENTIDDNWDVHLARMKDFWASVVLNAGRYNGRPVPKHQKLNEEHPAVQPAHFKIWLSLFHETLEETAPTSGAVPYFMERAERIAQSLQLAMFGVPGIPK